MPDYSKMQAELPKLRSALTRAKNSKDPRKILKAVAHAKARFDVIGWPDQWATWEIAESDAQIQLQRQRP